MAESTARFVRNLAALAKIEADYSTDAVPTGLLNAMQFNDVTVDPMAGGEVSRDLLLPYMGHQGVILTGTHGTLRGSVELAGAGAAGDVPAFGALLRMCGMAETITADTDVQYNPISTGFEAGTIYYNLDGVRHILLGCRGTLTLSLVPSQIPRVTYDFKGLSGTISDSPLPTIDLDAFIDPVPVNKANTTMSLHGWSAIAESLSLDLAATVEPRFLIGEESIKITDRRTTATSVVQAASLATKDWFAIAKAHTKGVLAVQHGTVAGNIVEIDAAGVQIGRVTQGATQGIANYSLPLMLTPVSGNDEFVLTFR
ncbi:MAG TPA: phage tail tube protein [Devosia sp.]|jgi:hypothetical protein|nr:phage tail tube protein [Devosia sp.]